MRISSSLLNHEFGSFWTSSLTGRQMHPRRIRATNGFRNMAMTTEVIRKE